METGFFKPLSRQMCAISRTLSHASPYQRTDLRIDHANGFKPRTINTLQGEIQLSIPQTRNGGFYPSCLEKGMRCVLGVRVELSEAEVHWRKFLESLIAGDFMD